MLNVAGFAADYFLFRAVRGEVLPWGVTAILSLALIPGILFLLCWWRSKRGSHE
jgi:hypothetical protein